METTKVFLLRLSLALIIAASLILTAERIYKQDWNTAIATISLFIAVVSAWVAFETFHNQAMAQKPQLSIRPNFGDRTGLILLTIKNHGENPAFNISVKWNTPIINSKEDTFNFSKGSKEYDVLVLGKNESVSTLLDGVVAFYTKFKDADLEYSGTISYSETLKSRRRQHQNFNVSLTSYKRLNNETDLALTHNSLQSIPDHLKSLEREINNLRKEITQAK